MIFVHFPALKTDQSGCQISFSDREYGANGRGGWGWKGKRGGKGAPLSQHSGPAVGDTILARMLLTKLVARQDDAMSDKLASLERQSR